MQAELLFPWYLPSRGADSFAKIPPAFVSGAAGITLEVSPTSNNRLASEG